MLRWPAFSPAARATFWRSLQTFNLTRVAIALVLLVYLLLAPDSVLTTAALYRDACIAWLAAGCLFAALTARWKRQFALQLSAQIAVDLLAISVLYVAAGGARSGLATLYLFPLAGSAILAPLLLALFAAALVSLFLLGEAGWQVLHLAQDGATLVRMAGLVGAALFAEVLVVSHLARRLIRQEELAARRGADLAVQQAVNDIVLADVGDGVLVAGRDGSIFASNPAARRMLGLADTTTTFRLAEVPALAPVVQAFADWQHRPDGGPAFVTVKAWDGDGPLAGVRGGLGEGAHLKLRFARVDTLDAADGRVVIFMQDVRAIENHAQQLKLASMGRLTASIAHEVRNPLAAIGHANALLAEDLHGPAEQRLLKIVGDNVTRVNRMVEDILQLSRKGQSGAEPLALLPFLDTLRAEFLDSRGLADDALWCGQALDVTVRFDDVHLRAVVLNLLNNAVRYASGAPGSIRLFTALDAAGRVELHVQDDGPAISAEVRAHLFEPFYTTSSKGTGLGLYLARELCLNNGAMLDYEYRFDARGDAPREATGRFVITFAPPERAGAPD